METIEQPSILQGERLPSELNTTHLTPLEHALIGSSIYVKRNGETELLNPEQILEKEEDFMLRIIGANLEPINSDQALKERKGKYLQGYFTIFHSSLMLKGGYEQRLWLPTELGEDGTIEPVFKVQLIQSDGEVIKDTEVVDRLLRVTQLQEYFRLEQDSLGNKILVFTRVKPSEQPIA